MEKPFVITISDFWQQMLLKIKIMKKGRRMQIIQDTRTIYGLNVAGEQ
jgi:hypothetical protein